MALKVCKVKARRALISSAVVAICFLGISEIVVRVSSQYFTSYDIEMSRYARELKMPSPNRAIGHVHRPNRRARLMNVEIVTNNDGLRDRDYPIARNGSRRAIFLGDSLTLGWGVEAAETFESVVEAELNRATPTEILNFGIGNYNTEQELSLFEEKGLKYAPDQVVVFYFINDAEPTPRQSSWEVLSALRSVTFFWSKIKTVSSRWRSSGSWNRYYADLYRDDQPGWLVEQRSFGALKQLCDRHGIGLRVVLLPEFHQLDPYPFAKEHAKVSRLLSELGIPSLDLAPFFRGERDPTRLWVARDDAHPNATAHALIARDVQSFVEDAWNAHARSD
jgi:lysophospholipase L1-like esterase